MIHFTPNTFIKAKHINNFWHTKTLYKVNYTLETDKRAYIDYTFGRHDYKNSPGYANDPSIWDEILI